MLLLAVLGFGNSFFLRPLSDLSPLRPSVFFHGLIMTAWFIGIFFQAILIDKGKFKAHHLLGWFLVCIGIVLILWSIVTTLNFVPGRMASGTNIEARLSFFSAIVWADFAALASFILFFTIAMIKRKHAEIHIPMMIYASISILEPALFRLWGWNIFGGLDRHLLSLAALMLLGLILVVYEYINVQKIQAVTASGIIVLLGFRVIAIYVISDSDFGISFIRALL